MDITIDPLALASQCRTHGIWSRFGDECPVCVCNESMACLEAMGMGRGDNMETKASEAIQITIPTGLTGDQRAHLAQWLRRVAKDIEVFGDEFKRRKTPVVYRQEEEP